MLVQIRSEPHLNCNQQPPLTQPLKLKLNRTSIPRLFDTSPPKRNLNHILHRNINPDSNNPNNNNSHTLRHYTQSTKKSLRRSINLLDTNTHTISRQLSKKCITQEQEQQETEKITHRYEIPKQASSKIKESDTEKKDKLIPKILAKRSIMRENSGYQGNGIRTLLERPAEILKQTAIYNQGGDSKKNLVGLKKGNRTMKPRKSTDVMNHIRYQEGKAEPNSIKMMIKDKLRKGKNYSSTVSIHQNELAINTIDNRNSRINSKDRMHIESSMANMQTHKAVSLLRLPSLHKVPQKCEDDPETAIEKYLEFEESSIELAAQESVRNNRKTSNLEDGNNCRNLLDTQQTTSLKRLKPIQFFRQFIVPLKGRRKLLSNSNNSHSLGAVDDPMNSTICFLLDKLNREQ